MSINRALVLCIATAALPALADVDVKTAMPVLLKVLTYDANFDSRGAGPFTVLVVSDPKQGAAREAFVSQLKDLSTNKIKARPVKYASADYSSDGLLQAEIDKAKASAILMLPGTPAPTVKAVWEVCQDNQLYALAFEAAMVDQVLPVGVSMVGDKPQIVINEKSSRAVGMRFEASVLKLARVVQ